MEQDKAVQSGKHIARVLKEEGVEYHFGLHGGHINALLVGCGLEGIKLVHVRHEQASSYCADGYAKASRKVGISFSTAGPGLTNQISGIAHCYYSRTPVVHFTGQVSRRQDGHLDIHESWGDQLCNSITKWTKRIVDPTQVAYWTKKAVCDALSYPQGPIVLEIPSDVLHARTTLAQQGHFVPDAYEKPLPPQGNPAAVERAVRTLLSAEMPAIAAGQDIWYSHAEDELLEFVELVNIPVITRRLGRGAVPEDHPLAFKSAARRAILRSADVAMTIGLAMNSVLEGWGAWAIGRRLIQIQPSMTLVNPSPPSEQIVIGDSKMVLQQMIDCVKQLYPKGVPKKTEWLQKLADLKAQDDKELIDEAAPGKNMKPLYPAWVAQESLSILEDDATIILDARSASTYVTTRYTCRKAATLLESSTHTGFGHGIGMGIGAQIARPGKQVLVIMGDAGMGVGAMDFETAVRCQIPVVYQVNNNHVWHPRSGPLYRKAWKLVGEQQDLTATFMHASNFANFAECFGGIGIRVEDPGEVAKAHAQAFEMAHAQNKPAIVDCLLDRTIGPRPEMAEKWADLAKGSLSWIDPEDVDEELRREMYPELCNKKE
jgi:acetolactate synthase-1/2/3 large subunit